MIRGAAISLFVALAAAPALAVAPEACTRYVASHAREHSAQDLGQGRVAWDWTWTNEGVAHDIFVVDCASGEGLRVFGQSVNMRRELPFDRRDDARAVIERFAGSGLFSFEWLADGLDRVNVTSEAVTLQAQPCACAAFYPDAGADLAPFDEVL